MDGVLKIDEIDAKILQRLIGEARSKITEIAEDNNLSPPAILKRIELMKENGLVIKSVLNVNLAFFNYPYMLLVGVSLQPEIENHIIELIKKHTIVAGIDRTIGKYDMCLFVFGKNLEDLDRLKKLIKKQKGINKIDINIWSRFQLQYDNINLRQ